MTQTSNKNSFEALVKTVHSLRAPGGCPWDRAQTHQSLRPYLIEEAYEVLDVLDQIGKAQDLHDSKIGGAFKEELGDLLMQVVLHSEMAEEAGAFDIYQVAQALNEKLIRRHPHVFGDIKADSAEQAFQRWEKEKAKEKANQKQDSSVLASVLDGVPKNLPALQRAARVLEKVTKVGFQWSDLQGPIEKMEEELAELKVELKLYMEAEDQNKENLRKKVEAELGDLFFTLCNVAFVLKISPEDSLRHTLRKFEKRFRHLESRLSDQGKTPEQSSLPEMDQFWDEAKLLEQTQVWGLTGRIASGKSTVGKILNKLGIPIIDADQIARELMEKNTETIDLVKNQFGTTDRTELRKLVFSDPKARKKLEEILHPFIQRESKKQIRQLAPRYPIIIYEATLLLETGRYQEFQGLILVEAPEELRKQRLVTRSKFSPEFADQIIQAQIQGYDQEDNQGYIKTPMTDEQRRQCATAVIDNTGTLETLEEKVRLFVQARKWI